jgi:hypothetical protein
MKVMKLKLIIILVCILVVFYLGSSSYKFKASSVESLIPDDFQCQGVWDTDPVTKFCSDKCKGAFWSYKFNIITPFDNDWDLCNSFSVEDYKHRCLLAAQDNAHSNAEWKKAAPQLDENFILSKTAVECNTNYTNVCPDQTIQESTTLRPDTNQCDGFWTYETTIDLKNPGEVINKCAFESDHSADAFCYSNDHKSFQTIIFKQTSGTPGQCNDFAIQKRPTDYTLIQNSSYLRAIGTEPCTFLRDCGAVCTLVDFRPINTIQSTSLAQCRTGLVTGFYGFQFQDVDFKNNTINLTCDGLYASQHFDRTGSMQIGYPNSQIDVNSPCPSDATIRQRDPVIAQNYKFYLGAFVQPSDVIFVRWVPGTPIAPDTLYEYFRAQLGAMLDYGRDIGPNLYRVRNKKEYVGRVFPHLSDEGGKYRHPVEWTNINDLLSFIDTLQQNKRIFFIVKYPNFPQEITCRLTIQGYDERNPMPDENSDHNYYVVPDRSKLNTNYCEYHHCYCSDDIRPRPSSDLVNDDFTVLLREADKCGVSYLYVKMVVTPIDNDTDVKRYHRCEAGYEPRFAQDYSIECAPVSTYFDVCDIGNQDEHPPCCADNSCSPFCSYVGSLLSQQQYIDMTPEQKYEYLYTHYHFSVDGREVCTDISWGPKPIVSEEYGNLTYLIYNIPRFQSSTDFLYMYLLQYSKDGKVMFALSVSEYNGDTLISPPTDFEYDVPYNELLDPVKYLTGMRRLEGQYVVWNRPYPWP